MSIPIFAEFTFSKNLTMTVGQTMTLNYAEDFGFPLASIYGGWKNELGADDPTAFSIIGNVHTYSNYTYYTFDVTARKVGIFVLKPQHSRPYDFYLYRNSNSHEFCFVSYNVTVVDVTSINIPPTLTCHVGDNYTFDPIITDNRASTTLRWQSSSPNVASIADGTMTVKAIGSTIISCTAHNGVSASCFVTVNPVLATGVSLNYSSYELQKSGTVKLVATIAPNNATDKSVTWKSSDETVAVVASDGTVTGLKSGSCNITATTVDGSNKSASCLIKVYDVTSIGIPGTLQMIVGKTYQFEPTIIDSKATTTLTWKSTNPSVAEINSSGFLTAKVAGTATITCTAHNGVFAQCEVTVKTNQILATSILLNKTSAEMEQGATLQLTATVSPSDATNKSVAWSSSSPDIAYVSGDGLVTAVKPGTCTIVATTLDGSNLSAACQVHVLVKAGNWQSMKVWSNGEYEQYDVSEVDSVEFAVHHEYVDLGLPSGTLWATCNVGASSTEEYGDFFAWGETTGHNSGKACFNWSTYKYCKGTEKTLTKYCSTSDYGFNGFSDTLTELLPEDDAATANWGSDWQTPSLDQLKELYNSSYTIMEWTSENGVYGRKITSKTNGNTIFLPAAGRLQDAVFSFVDTYGEYWSRSLNTSESSYASILGFNSSAINMWSSPRGIGRTIRPVRVKN